jgi:hypothetical protein
MWSSIPEIPDGETVEKMEKKVNQLKKVCLSSRPDQSVVQSLMLETYPIRRKAVLEQTADLKSLLTQYPPLEKSSHVSACINDI